jgi:hypothetical protein
LWRKKFYNFDTGSNFSKPEIRQNFDETKNKISSKKPTLHFDQNLNQTCGNCSFPGIETPQMNYYPKNRFRTKSENFAVRNLSGSILILEYELKGDRAGNGSSAVVENAKPGDENVIKLFTIVSYNFS